MIIKFLLLFLIKLIFWNRNTNLRLKLNTGIQPSSKNLKRFIFLKDVFWLTISAFGGPQAHIAMMLHHLVEKRKYLSEEELLELQALCQILPGPTSTQTITAIAYRKGGTILAFLTLLVWILPAASIMCTAAIGLTYLKRNNISIEFIRFIKPIAVGFVAFAAFKITSKVIKTKTQIVLMILAGLTSYFFSEPWLFPLIIVIGGFITAREYRRHHRERDKKPIKIKWINLIIFFIVLTIGTLLSKNIKYEPIQLFESFYRNGSLIFGGGQVLVPYLQTEFVDIRKLLTNDDFLTGFGIVQAMPGPVFSFSSFVGAIASQKLGVNEMILGAFTATIGVFLPGTLLIFFVIKFWDELKKFRIVRASLEGINATSSGLVCASVFLLFRPIQYDWINYPIVVLTFILLKYTKIPAPILILSGLGIGYIFTII